MKLVPLHCDLRISAERVREIVAFVKPLGTPPNFILRIEPKKVGARIALKKVKGYREVQVYVVPLDDGRCDKRCLMNVNWCGGISLDLYTLEEIILFHVAVGLRLHWQFANPKGQRVYGAKRGRYSWRDAGAYGIHKVRQWRRRQPPLTVSTFLRIREALLKHTKHQGFIANCEVTRLLELVCKTAQGGKWVRR
jgi:hypothetical protein